MALILSSPHCLYCGSPNFGSADHFIPISKQLPDEHNFEVPCCLTCNLTAGAKRFPTIEDKFYFIQGRRMRRKLPVNLPLCDDLLKAVIAAIPHHVESDSSYTRNRRSKLKPNA